jgi:hypothetical protein
MNSPKRWTILVVLVLAILVGTVVTVNVIVDADGILRTNYTRQFQPPNMSVAKINYLLRNKSKYDSYVFGSSREGNILVGHINDGRWYNMFLAAGLPEEYLDHLKLMLANGITVKTVMIGLDDFSHLFDARQLLSDLDLQPHPAVSGKSLFAFYGENFFRLNRIVPQVSAYIRYNYTHWQPPDRRQLIYDIEGSGNIFCRDCDEAVERNVQEHIHAQKFLRPWEYRFLEGNNLTRALDVMREIADLSRKNNIRLIVFFNPIHKTTYLNTDLERFAEFKHELAKIMNYYDFSGLNSITTNNYYYYETSHFRPLVGDMMLSRMLGSPRASIPDDFGVLVTKENSADHLRSLCLQLKAIPSGLGGANAAWAASCK